MDSSQQGRAQARKGCTSIGNEQVEAPPRATGPSFKHKHRYTGAQLQQQTAATKTPHKGTGELAEGNDEAAEDRAMEDPKSSANDASLSRGLGRHVPGAAGASAPALSSSRPRFLSATPALGFPASTIFTNSTQLFNHFGNMLNTKGMTLTSWCHFSL